MGSNVRRLNRLLFPLVLSLAFSAPIFQSRAQECSDLFNEVKLAGEITLSRQERNEIERRYGSRLREYVLFDQESGQKKTIRIIDRALAIRLNQAELTSAAINRAEFDRVGKTRNAIENPDDFNAFKKMAPYQIVRRAEWLRRAEASLTKVGGVFYIAFLATPPSHSEIYPYLFGGAAISIGLVTMRETARFMGKVAALTIANTIGRFSSAIRESRFVEDNWAQTKKQRAKQLAKNLYAAAKDCGPCAAIYLNLDLHEMGIDLAHLHKFLVKKGWGRSSLPDAAIEELAQLETTEDPLH